MTLPGLVLILVSGDDHRGRLVRQDHVADVGAEPRPSADIGGLHDAQPVLDALADDQRLGDWRERGGAGGGYGWCAE